MPRRRLLCSQTLFRFMCAAARAFIDDSGPSSPLGCRPASRVEPAASLRGGCEVDVRRDLCGTTNVISCPRKAGSTKEWNASSSRLVRSPSASLSTLGTSFVTSLASSPHRDAQILDGVPQGIGRFVSVVEKIGFL